jgi:type 1 glutamine amidotransferase
VRPAAALALLALLLGATPAAEPARNAASATTPAFRVLAFTKTAGYRHGSIADALAAVEKLGAANGFGVDRGEDAGAFNDANLARYKVVMFLMTTGDVLDANQQLAMERFIRAGGGFVGVHSAVDTEYDWPWYGGLVGAYFTSHPAIQQATINVSDSTDPSTAGLPKVWVRTDEWYNFRTNPRANVNVLATIDETSYDPGPDAMGSDHPIAWSHAYDGGRAWYTAGGHTFEAWYEPLFLAHVLGGIKWAAGPVPTALPAAISRAPELRSVTTSLSGKRVVVTVRHSACACDIQLAVSVRGRTLTTMKAVSGGTTTRLTSAALPKGRWQLRVTVKPRPAGQSAVVRRTINVP